MLQLSLAHPLVLPKPKGLGILLLPGPKTRAKHSSPWKSTMKRSLSESTARKRHSRGLLKWAILNNLTSYDLLDLGEVTGSEPPFDTNTHLPPNLPQSPEGQANKRIAEDTSFVALKSFSGSTKRDVMRPIAWGPHFRLSGP